MIVDVDLFRRWDVIAMCLAMAILFVLEMLGVFTDQYITITAIVRSQPAWLLWMEWGWLGWHFLSKK
jgi:hypothetical protein